MTFLKNQVVLRYFQVKKEDGWKVCAICLGHTTPRGDFIESDVKRFEVPKDMEEVRNLPLKTFFGGEEPTEVSEKEHEGYVKRGFFPKTPQLTLLQGGADDKEGCKTHGEGNQRVSSL